MEVFFFRDLIQKSQFISLPLINDLINRFHIICRIHGHCQFFRQHLHTLRQFSKRRFSPQCFFQLFSCSPDAILILLNRSADLQDPVIPQETFDLSDDHWHGICGKFHIIRCIKFVHCFQKTDTSDLKEIFHIHTTSQKALCRTVDQSCIFMKQALSRLFIPLVRTPDQGKSVLRHLSLPANGLLHMNSSPLARL